MNGSLDRSPEPGRRRGRSDVEDALSAGHVQHVLVEVSQPDRRTVLYYSDDLERHVAVGDNRRANRVAASRKVRPHEVLVDDYGTESTRSITFVEIASFHRRDAHRLEIVRRDERDRRTGLPRRS